MHRPALSPIPAILVGAALVLAACGGTETVSPTETHDMDAMPTATPDAPATTEPTADETDAAEPTEAADPTEAATAEVEVRLNAGAFAPTELTVDAGTAVGFTNTSQFAHTVTEGTAGQAAPGATIDHNVARNQTVVVTFDEPGTYDLTCRFHPSMQMTVIVEG